MRPESSDRLVRLRGAAVAPGVMPTKDALRKTFAWPSTRRSLGVALVIGTILNAINQGSEIWAGQPVVAWKLLLTYFVPFAVASYGSFAALRSS